VFALDRSGLVGQDGPTHNGSFDMSYLRHIPNMVVMAPKDENELKQMLFSAFCYEKPASVRYPRGEAIGVPVNPEFCEIPVGTWETLKEGTDITLMACGTTVYPSLDAAMDLQNEGIDCAVVNGRFIKPMDREMIINLATHTQRVLTIEENSIIGGFGSGVMEVLSEEGIRVPVKRAGLPDRFMYHGSQKAIRQHIGLDKEGIKKTVRHWLSKE
jgi:1-deoxy-D-xylulose-5-phosphate synthase